MIKVIDTDANLNVTETRLMASVPVTVETLISIRELITNQIPGFGHQVSIVDDIDAVLRQVPPGARRDVDLLLGRM